MLTYMWTRIFCGGAMVISFGIAAISDFYEYDFLCNIMLGIFGSSFLTWLSTFIAYRVTRREAIMEYLMALRLYRMKFRRLVNLNGKSDDNWSERKDELKEYFYEWFAVYSKIQHICKPLCKYRKIPKILDQSFQLIVDVQGNLNCSYQEYEAYSQNIDKAIDMVEKLAQDKKYLHTMQEKE